MFQTRTPFSFSRLFRFSRRRGQSADASLAPVTSKSRRSLSRRLQNPASPPVAKTSSTTPNGSTGTSAAPVAPGDVGPQTIPLLASQFPTVDTESRSPSPLSTCSTLAEAESTALPPEQRLAPEHGESGTAIPVAEAPRAKKSGARRVRAKLFFRRRSVHTDVVPTTRAASTTAAGPGSKKARKTTRSLAPSPDPTMEERKPTKWTRMLDLMPETHEAFTVLGGL